MNFNWPRLAAKVFAVATMGVGVGFVSGGIAFVNIGPTGDLHNSPFGHIAEVIGLGSGCLMASLMTSAMLLYQNATRKDGKPDAPSTRGLD